MADPKQPGCPPAPQYCETDTESQQRSLSGLLNMHAMPGVQCSTSSVALSEVLRSTWKLAVAFDVDIWVSQL